LFEGIMADLKRARRGNRPGDFFVDDTCIDCDTCRWVARGLFTQVGDGSAVTRQPGTPDERRSAFLALKACPTHSIGCSGDKRGLGEADFPLKLADGLYYLGYASEHSFGAASFLLVRGDHSVMIDSPRFHEPLAKAIEALGPVRWLVLTHRDDIADQARWAERFKCKRVLHKDDVPRSAGDIEVQPQGLDPVVLEPGLSFIPVPGHTRGHAVLHADDRYLFTGDHLEFDEDAGGLRAFKDFCWYDWGEQTRSMERLLPLKFEWVLPGHGRMKQAPAPQMSAWLKDCVAWMKE
jgi:glyoxylase-like metal-dependent hydrolase (beta-lactamase superfamily II)/ferredoxin